MMVTMRQPVHVVYGGAHLFKSDTTRKLGTLAERAVAEYAPDAAAWLMRWVFAMPWPRRSTSA